MVPVHAIGAGTCSHRALFRVSELRPVSGVDNYAAGWLGAAALAA